MKKTITRGNVYLVTDGNTEQPMLIISNHEANKHSPVLIGIPIERHLSCNEKYSVSIGTHKKRTQYAMCHKIMHIDRSRIGEIIYRANRTSMKRIEDKLVEVLALNDNTCKQNELRGRIAYSYLTGQGSEQTGMRPVVIVSNENINQDSDVPNVICVCGTSRLSKTPLPTHICVEKEVGVFKEDTLLLCEQIGSVKKKKLILTDKYVHSMLDINKATKIALGINRHPQKTTD